MEHAPAIERKPEPPKEKKSKGAKGLATPAESSGGVTPSDAPSRAETPAPSKKQEKALKAAAASEGAKDVESGASTPGGKAQKKEKKEKKTAEEGKKGGKAAADDAGEPVPSMVDLRVGHIVQSECFVCDMVLLKLTCLSCYSRETP